jgi:hypothetical protein
MSKLNYLLNKYNINKKIFFIIISELLLIILDYIFNISIFLSFYINFIFISFNLYLITVLIIIFNIPLYKINFKKTVIYNYFLLLSNDLLHRLLYFGTYDDGTDGMYSMSFVISIFISLIFMIIYNFIFKKDYRIKSLFIIFIGFVLSCIIYYFVNSNLLNGRHIDSIY